MSQSIPQYTRWNRGAFLMDIGGNLSLISKIRRAHKNLYSLSLSLVSICLSLTQSSDPQSTKVQTAERASLCPRYQSLRIEVLSQWCLSLLGSQDLPASRDSIKQHSAPIRAWTWSQTTWAQSPPLPLLSCVTLDLLLNLYGSVIWGFTSVCLQYWYDD